LQPAAAVLPVLIEEHAKLDDLPFFFSDQDRLYLSLARLAEARFKPRRDASEGRASA
ncbi:MAG: hypothetical protein HW416_3943, partial [Chloroflexi bacterium]|nr:hypothetical protein [Chloroflexota bacterium]